MKTTEESFAVRPGLRAWGIALLCGWLLAGCLHRPLPIDIVWPVPPDQPVIRYLRAYRASSDVEATSKGGVLVNILLGGAQKVYVVKKPYGVHLDPFGRLLVGDTGWGRVLVFDIPNNKFEFYGGDAVGGLVKPACIATDTDGTIYVSDIALHRVYVYSKDGKFIRGLGKEDRFKQPVGVAVDRERHRVYVVDINAHNFVIFGTDGNEIKTVGKRGGGKGEFNYPTNVAVAPNGDIFIVDTFNFRVQRFDSDGKFLNMWGKPGNLSGMFTRPKGVAVDRDSHVYVVDAAFHNVQVFRPDGKLLMTFGGVGPGLGQFHLPAGIGISPDGDIYIANQLNRRVDKLRYLGAPQMSTGEVSKDSSAGKEAGSEAGKEKDH